MDHKIIKLHIALCLVHFSSGFPRYVSHEDASIQTSGRGSCARYPGRCCIGQLCIIGVKDGSGVCFCDVDCHRRGECCQDVGCERPRTCAAANLPPGCCVGYYCRANGCYCDRACRWNNDCCEDVNQCSSLQASKSYQDYLQQRRWAYMNRRAPEQYLIDSVNDEKALSQDLIVRLERQYD